MNRIRLTSSSKPKKPDNRTEFEQSCLDKIVHCLREIQVLNRTNRAGSLAYRIMETELEAWREELDMYRKSHNITQRRIR